MNQKRSAYNILLLQFRRPAEDIVILAHLGLGWNDYYSAAESNKEYLPDKL